MNSEEIYLYDLDSWKRKVWTVTSLIVGILFMMLIVSIGSVLGQEKTLGDDFHLFQNISLKQECDCTEVIFTRVINPDDTTILINGVGEKNGTAFNYTLNGSLINVFGKYLVTGYGNFTETGLLKTFSYDFEVNKQAGLIGFDFKNPLNLIGIGISIVTVVLMLFHKGSFWLGFAVFLVGLLLGFNGMHWTISIAMVFLGISNFFDNLKGGKNNR